MSERPVALVTGASAGLGAVFARALAQRGCDLVLVARRVERLERLAEELRREFAVEAEALPADLSEPADIARVEQRIRALDRLEYLVNNAGFGVRGYFIDSDIDRHVEMQRVHMLAPLRLTHAALGGMLRRKRGNIINVSSLGSFLPMPGNVNYNASKAYLNTFTLSLSRELAGSGVRVQALCPGFIYTDFHKTPQYASLNAYQRIPRFFWDTPERVVAASLRALPHGPVVYVPFFKNQMIALGGQIGFIGMIYAIMASWFRHKRG
jgi:short-subunit dehydrogenase